MQVSLTRQATVSTNAPRVSGSVARHEDASRAALHGPERSSALPAGSAWSAGATHPWKSGDCRQRLGGPLNRLGWNHRRFDSGLFLHRPRSSRDRAPPSEGGDRGSTPRGDPTLLSFNGSGCDATNVAIEVRLLAGAPLSRLGDWVIGWPPRSGRGSGAFDSRIPDHGPLAERLMHPPLKREIRVRLSDGPPRPRSSHGRAPLP